MNIQLACEEGVRGTAEACMLLDAAGSKSDPGGGQASPRASLCSARRTELEDGRDMLEPDASIL